MVVVYWRFIHFIQMVHGFTTQYPKHVRKRQRHFQCTQVYDRLPRRNFLQAVVSPPTQARNFKIKRGKRHILDQSLMIPQATAQGYDSLMFSQPCLSDQYAPNHTTRAINQIFVQIKHCSELRSYILGSSYQDLVLLQNKIQSTKGNVLQFSNLGKQVIYTRRRKRGQGNRITHSRDMNPRFINIITIDRRQIAYSSLS